MTVKNDLLGGTDYVDGDTPEAVDLNDTNNALIGAGNLMVPLWVPDSVGAGNWVLSISTSKLFNAIFTNTGGAAQADLDNVTYKVSLIPGTYTIKIIGVRQTDAGILDIDLDGVEVASFDFYGTPSNNFVQTDATVTVTATGVVDLDLRVDGKNGSSSDYIMSLVGLWLYRTGV